MKIQSQLVLFFSIIIIASIGSTAFFAISFAESGIIKAEIEAMNGNAEEMEHEIDMLHANAISDLTFALKNPKFVEYFELPETKAGNSYENGILQYTENQKKIKDELEIWMYNFQKKFDVDEICIIDTTGQEHARLVLGSIADPPDLSSEEEHMPFFDNSFQKELDEVHVQHPYVSPDTNRLVFAYASPIVLDNGEKPAILHFEMPLEVFQNIILEEQNEKSGRAFVINSEKSIILSSEEIISKNEFNIQPEKDFPLLDVTFEHENNDIFEEMIENHSGSGVYYVDGEKRQFVYNNLSMFDWILINERSTSNILETSNTIKNLTNIIIFIAIIVSQIGVFGVILLSSKISGPIKKLAEQISNENPERLEPISSTSQEVKSIRNSFNKLLNRITKNQEEIHMQNNELMIQKRQLERWAIKEDLLSSLIYDIKNPLIKIKEISETVISKTTDESDIQKLENLVLTVEYLQKEIFEILTIDKKHGKK